MAHCFYVDYDGTKYGAVSRKFPIEYYEGEKDVKELQVYPLRFAKEADELLERSESVGRKFSQYVKEWHLTISGWTTVTDPIGIPLLKSTGFGYREQEQTDYLEGEAIVDFNQAFCAEPENRCSFVNVDERDEQDAHETAESLTEILVWSNTRRRTIVSRIADTVVGPRHYEAPEVEALVQEFPYLSKAARPVRVLEKDLALLPPRLFVYALRHGRFAAVNVKDMTVIPKEDTPFERLQLPDNHRRMIQAAVHSHLIKRRVEKKLELKDGRASTSQDLIQGKGKGLVILLHGEPGVGKTATAEAVALSTGRPLFPVSWSPTTDLKLIFRLAHLWDCTLLMDEVDVFLSARSVNNQFNTLVSGTCGSRLYKY